MKLTKRQSLLLAQACALEPPAMVYPQTSSWFRAICGKDFASAQKSVMHANNSQCKKLWKLGYFARYEDKGGVYYRVTADGRRHNEILLAHEKPERRRAGC